MSDHLLDAAIEKARRVAGWLGALAPLDHPDSPRAVKEGSELVALLLEIRRELGAS